MPKRRKPLSELVKSGTLHKNLGRYEGRIAAQGVVIAPIGAAPRHLLATERAIWAEVTKNAPAGLLGRSDRLIIEILSRLVARTRSGEYKTSDLNATVAILSRLGMTPADRLRLGVDAPPAPVEKSAEDTAWDELAELD